MSVRLVTELSVRELDDALMQARATDTATNLVVVASRQSAMVLPSGRVTVREMER